MELELKKEQFACYQALPQLSENREETTETIVPDYLPDIARKQAIPAAWPSSGLAAHGHLPPRGEGFI